MAVQHLHVRTILFSVIGFKRCSFMNFHSNPLKKYATNIKPTKIINFNYLRSWFSSYENKCATTDETDNLGEDSSILCTTVSNEMHFYRDARNYFPQVCFHEKEYNSVPLVLLVPWNSLQSVSLKKLIQFYAEKGFDILTIKLSKEQLLFPCVSGGAMNVVSDLLEYLSENHKSRPYVVHGFSVGVYIYGEILAQLADHHETYKGMSKNFKGCLWDSPVDITTTRQMIGYALYPKNFIKRWRCNLAVNRHFKRHDHDSVSYWLRSREHFCDPCIKVPNVFFLSCTDLLSNPTSLSPALQLLEENGVPVHQKTWCDSDHTCHFGKYCYEYLYGMELFFNLASLFPDDTGKYRSGTPVTTLNALKFRRKAIQCYTQ